MTDDDQQASRIRRAARACTRQLREVGDTSRDFLLFVVVVAVVIAAAVFLEPDNKIVLLKLFAVTLLLAPPRDPLPPVFVAAEADRLA